MNTSKKPSCYNRKAPPLTVIWAGHTASRGSTPGRSFTLKKANTLRPRHTHTLVDLALACSDAGQNDRAIELLKEAVAIQPEHAAAHANLGAVYGIIGRYDTSIQYLSKALELQPDYVEAHKNLGLSYRAKGLYPRAIEHFEKALELRKGRAKFQTYLNVGDTYYDMGEHEKAIPYFQKAVQLDPNHANAHVLLGLAYRALNRGGKPGSNSKRRCNSSPTISRRSRSKSGWSRPANSNRPDFFHRKVCPSKITQTYSPFFINLKQTRRASDLA